MTTRSYTVQEIDALRDALADVLPLARRFIALQRANGIDVSDKVAKVQAASAALRKAEGVEE